MGTKLSAVPSDMSSAALLDTRLGEPKPALLSERSRSDWGQVSQMKAKRATTRDGRHSTLDLGAPGSEGELIVQSSESGARISLNSRHNAKWVTPHLFSLAAGTYIVSVSKEGYATWTRRLQVGKGREEWIMASLIRDRGTGILILDSDPPGMPVVIDGKPSGVTHMETVLDSGWHQCEVLPGNGNRPVTGEFRLQPGEILTRKIRFSPASGSAPTTASH